MNITQPIFRKIIAPVLGLIFGMLLIFGVLMVFQWATEPLQPESEVTQRLIIKKGESVSSIAERLTAQGMIRNALVFKLVVRYMGLEDSIQAGSFVLSPSQDIWQIAQSLTEGTEDVWVTIPEGYRLEEIAETFTQADLLVFNAEEFISLAQPYEGYLFPDTYLVPREITTEAVIELLRNTFETKVTKALSSEISQSQYSLSDAIIMASLIQREAGKDTEEMRHVAGVLWNRVAVGQGLGVDATLQYIAGYNENTERWWSAPDVRLKDSNSPYNTYKFAGLPPTPIANPGAAAVQAALDPLPTNDYFYLHANGNIYYAQDLAGHNRNIERYLR